MGSGTMSDKKLGRIEALIPAVPGDLAEIGTGGGATFWRLAAMAARRDCLAHGYDSFIGMPEPGEHDSSHYPKGTFDVGGVAGFRQLLDEFGADPAYYRLWPGFVPACFEGADDLRFSFIYCDLDAYEPTVLALEWVWPRLVDGGILLLDDWFPANEKLKKRMATRALTEWLPQHKNDLVMLDIENDQAMVRKLKGADNEQND